jgi:hypothetical protein
MHTKITKPEEKGIFWRVTQREEESAILKQNK